jgi:hypothetical protein
VSPLPHDNKHKTSAVPPFNVPALRIPLPSPIAIGNPLNARSGTPGRESPRIDEPSDSAQSPPRSARQGAWSKSRVVASEQNERSVSARSCSPPLTRVRRLRPTVAARLAAAARSGRSRCRLWPAGSQAAGFRQR